MKRIDGYLSRKAQQMFPKALVFCENGGPVEVWTMEWAGTPTVGLGGCFNAAKQAVDALISAERAKSPFVKPNEH
jgi:hypothetical protein